VVFSALAAKAALFLLENCIIEFSSQTVSKPRAGGTVSPHALQAVDDSPQHTHHDPSSERSDARRYNLCMLPDLQMNDRLRLRKPHPCGSYEWKVVRLGADIGLACMGCQHRVLLTRRELMKRMKSNLSQQERERPIDPKSV
jgi:hypothetical protein